MIYQLSTKIEAPIGIFDSGLGGLTVASEVMERLPNEDILYFGDLAHTPYGAKSPEAVGRFSERITSFFIEKGVKIVVVACNTASSVALERLQAKFDIPIIGVIEPGASLAVKVTTNNRIGVIGTATTISSNIYPKLIKSINYEVTIFTKACPLFVPLVEEGWIDHEVTRLVAKEYLSQIKEEGIDTLILGCTHYPLLLSLLKEIMGNEVILVDSATAVAERVRVLLEESGSLRVQNRDPKHKFYVTDDPCKFIQLGERFLGRKIQEVTYVDLE